MEQGLMKLESITRAQARVGLRKQAITWALTFAQMDLQPLLEHEQAMLAQELFAYVQHPPRGISHDGEYVEDVFNLELPAAQQVLLRVFHATVAREPVPTLLQGNSQMVWIENRYVLVPFDNEDLLEPAALLQAVTVRLLTRLPSGYRLNSCQAPRLRQDELCQRLFLTHRAWQRYCSLVCQQRAGHRRNQRPDR